MSATFGQRLKAARVMAGLSMDGLVERLGKRLSKPAISKYENGRMMPDGENRILLADALGVDPDFFFSERAVELSAINFRKKASLGKKAVESFTERVKDAMDRYLELETLLGLDAPFVNPLEGVFVGAAADIEAAALSLRSAWGIGPNAAIPHVLDLLEERAVRVIELDGGEGFDGVSGKVDGRPFIVLNANRPIDRKRLTALHEFAHQCIVFKDGLSDTAVDTLCRTFSGAFLIPAGVLRRELGEKRTEISLYELRALKERCGISMQAIMRRAKLHGIITAYAHERFSKFAGAHGWREAEPVTYQVMDVPRRFDQLLHRSLAEGVITVAKAAALARKPIPQIAKEIALSEADTHP